MEGFPSPNSRAMLAVRRRDGYDMAHLQGGHEALL